MPRITKPATKARRNKEHLDRLTVLLDAAENVFNEKGYLLTTTDMVAEKAVVSIGTVYNFFDSKDTLYACVVERIAEDLLNHVHTVIMNIGSVESAIEELIRYRMLNFKRQQLFFVLFSCERFSGVYPEPATLPNVIKERYWQYMDKVTVLFQRGMEQKIFQTIHPLYLALSLEGIINAFIGYWRRPQQAASLDTQVQEVKKTFFKMASTFSAGTEEAAVVKTASPMKSRDVYITYFDYGRLKELLNVARAFGDNETTGHLDSLNKALSEAKIVESKAIPTDVVSMNSRLRLRKITSGQSQVVTLVFPVDVNGDPDAVSVLDPLGTALIGCRVGTTIELDNDERTSYQIEAMLYQPEAAGDFHR